MSGPERDLHARGRLILTVALVFTTISILLAIVLLIKETAITFVTFMFLGPVLLLLAVAGLGWVIFPELRAKKSLRTSLPGQTRPPQRWTALRSCRGGGP